MSKELRLIVRIRGSTREPRDRVGKRPRGKGDWLARGKDRKWDNRRAPNRISQFPIPLPRSPMRTLRLFVLGRQAFPVCCVQSACEYPVEIL